MIVLLRRLFEMVPTLLGVSLLTFLMIRLTPGDPVKMMLGPEASEESVDRKRVELHFKKYAGGTPDIATIVEAAGGQVTFTLAGVTARREDAPPLAVHFGDARFPVAAAVDAGSTETLRFTARAGADTGELRAGEAVPVLLDRTLAHQSVFVQYALWLRDVLRLDLGNSITSGRPVTDEIMSRMWATFELAIFSMVFAVLTGLAVGILSAVYPRTLIDSASRLFVFVFLAMPSFWLGLELIILLSRTLPIFPPAGRAPSFTFEGWRHLFLPALTLGVGTGAFLSRILRSSMLQVLNADFVRTARAKGLNERRVILKHALKNALIPFITVTGISLGALLGGSVIVETVFSWPGVGKLMVDSIKERDFPVTMGCVLVLATIFVLVNLIVDLLYAVIDPRIRLDNAAGG